MKKIAILLSLAPLASFAAEPVVATKGYVDSGLATKAEAGEVVKKTGENTITGTLYVPTPELP